MVLGTLPQIHHNLLIGAVGGSETNVVGLVAVEFDGALGVGESVDVVSVVLGEVDSDVVGGWAQHFVHEVHP